MPEGLDCRVSNKAALILAAGMVVSILLDKFIDTGPSPSLDSELDPGRHANESAGRFSAHLDRPCSGSHLRPLSRNEFLWIHDYCEGSQYGSTISMAYIQKMYPCMATPGMNAINWGSLTKEATFQCTTKYGINDNGIRWSIVDGRERCSVFVH